MASLFDGAGDCENELGSIERRLPLEFWKIGYGEQQVLGSGLIQLQNIAGRQPHEVFDTDSGSAQLDGALHLALLDLSRDLPSGLGVRLSRSAGEPLLSAELAGDRLDDQVRDTKAHRAALLADFDFEEDGHDDVVGRGDLHELGAGLEALDDRVHDDDAFPGRFESAKEPLDALPYKWPFNIGERRSLVRLAWATEHPIDNGKGEFELKLQYGLSAQRLQGQNGEHRLVDTAQILLIRNLFEGDQFDGHGRPQVSGHRRTRHPAKRLMENLQRSQLIFAELVGSSKIVELIGN